MQMGSRTLSIQIVVLVHEYSQVVILFPLMTEQEVLHSSQLAANKLCLLWYSL